MNALAFYSETAVKLDKWDEVGDLGRNLAPCLPTFTNGEMTRLRTHLI